MRPLIVGELNPYGSDPAFALYPLPEHASGGRLCQLLNMSHGRYLALFDRVNLCEGKWEALKARDAARALRLDNAGRQMILLGRKVAGAFGFRDVPFFSRPSTDGRFLLLPHPSGLCRVWNEPENQLRARELVADTIRRALR